MKFVTLLGVIIIVAFGIRGCQSLMDPSKAAAQAAKDRQYLDRKCGYPNCGVR
jgi:hypothetical protein